MATTYHEDIQQLYVAYFNRPADKAGLEFWETVVEAGKGDTSAISAAFAASNEYKTHYAGMTSHQIVAEVYTNLFGRAPEQAGLDFWANGMDAGLFTIDNAVTAIAAGAQGSDLTAYNNKVTAATRFTNALDTDSEIGKYGNAGADINARAKVFLDGITDDASLAAYMNVAGMDDAVLTVLGRDGTVPTTPTTPTTPIGTTPSVPVDPGTPDPAPAPSVPVVPVDPVTPAPEPAPTVIATLTVNDDDLTGTAGNDLFMAGTDSATGVLVLNGHDKIDGGAGTDTIQVTSAMGGVTLDGALTISNIEKLTIKNTEEDVNANLSAWTGLQHVSVEQLGVDKTVKLTTSDNVSSVSITGGKDMEIIDAGATGALARVSFDGSTGTSYVKSNALTSLNMSNIEDGGVFIEGSAAPHTLDVTLDHVSGANWAGFLDNTATTVNITATGAASDLVVAIAAATRINISGDQHLTMQLPDGAQVDSVYVSTNTAGVHIKGTLSNGVAFNGGAGADEISLSNNTRASDMGAGDDIVTMSGEMGTGGTLAGGAGNDTLMMNTRVAGRISASDAAISGFEILKLSPYGSSSQVIDLAKFNGNVNHIILDGNNSSGSGDSAGLVFMNLANNATLELTSPNSGTMDVQVSGAAAGSTDVLNIKLNSSSELVNPGTLTAANIETVNIMATDYEAGAYLSGASKINLVAADATKVTISGSHGVDFTGSTLGNLVYLDASNAGGAGAIGAVTFASQATDKAMSVKTAGGNDSIDLRSVTSVGAGATVDTGAGDDTVWGTAGNDSIKLGDGRDTVYSSAGADVITLGGGNDVYVLQQASHSGATVFDKIVDFTANTVAGATIAAGATATVADLNGDTISIKVGASATSGIAVSVKGSEADALNFLQSTSANSAAHATGIALDSTTGKLYVDLDADGVADSVIVLTGVNSITEAAFVVTH